ncbi:helicase [Tetragenococcus halophilus subsp. flandriensis]|uniref:PH domain-containing protein n=1 Tax=Tetragenococcus halophilus TaxID=51669 RepID=UPI0023E9DC65|nr:PH domain-containing protein [Tetragenococcus halophilus]GMA06985.1 helicase [Tetragenococcus halophilus subsp. flandriensis]
MSLFDGIIGNASEVKNSEVEKELEAILIPGENVDLAFKLIRDLIIFTDYRLIVADKQGVTGKKVEYKSYPYKSISRFSTETMGHFDMDAEFKIWISGATEPAESLEFRKDKNISDIQKALAQAILK